MQVLASNSKGFNNQMNNSGVANSNILASSANPNNVTNIHNIKNYNNYHFEVKTQGSGPVMQFLPEDSRSLDRIINGNINATNGGKPEQNLNMMINKRPVYNSQNPNQSSSNFNKTEVKG